MSRIFSGFSIIAVAIALVLSFGSLNVAKAVPGQTDEGYTLPPGQSNMFGYEPADNSAAYNQDRDQMDRDTQRAHDFDRYGLGMQSQE